MDAPLRGIGGGARPLLAPPLPRPMRDTGNIHTNGDVQPYGFRAMRADRQTNRHARCNTSHPSRGRCSNKERQWMHVLPQELPLRAL